MFLSHSYIQKAFQMSYMLHKSSGTCYEIISEAFSLAPSSPLRSCFWLTQHSHPDRK